MFRRLSVLLAVVLLASIPISGFAGRLSYKGTFQQGSLVAKGEFTGVGSTDVVVKLEAFGMPVVTCTSPGGNEAPGQNPSRASSSNQQDLKGVVKNGKAPYLGVAPNPTLTWDQAGCANPNWAVRVDGVLWDTAIITVNEMAGGAEVFKRTYCLKSTSIVPGTPVQVVACN